MFKIGSICFFLVVFSFIIANISFSEPASNEADFLVYKVNPKLQELKLFWKDDNNKPFKSILNLKNWLETRNKKLVFATNAGMYQVNNAPLGLYIEEGKKITPLNVRNAKGNFYWKPNGVLYIDTDNNAIVCNTENFVNNGKIKYATQSGPMLVFDGKIHPEFKKGSTNVNIRNGVGILPNNELVFVMSKKEMNLYDFANYFKDAGCKSALSFDGFVCRTYLPEKDWVQTDGNFGVIVAVIAN